jgi:hypothetical protein
MGEEGLLPCNFDGLLRLYLCTRHRDVGRKPYLPDLSPNIDPINIKDELPSQCIDS